jgi:hypothetical protein
MNLTGSSLPWPGVVRPYIVPGLSTCLEERRLCRDGSPLPVSRLEVEALCLAEWAVARGRTLVLCPADPLAPLSELIAAAVHVADMAEQYRRSGVALGSSRRVAVVTSDYHARGLYRSLGVRNPRGLSVAPLRDVVPAATLGRDAVVRVLGHDPGRGWSTVFVPSVAAARTVGRLDLAVVELPAPGAEEVLDLGVPVVIVARDPADSVLVRLGDGALVFGWDRADLARVRDETDLPPRLACRAAGGLCEIVAVPAHAVCENAALFWQDVGPLVRSGGRSAVARDLSREAFSLFYDLMGLALPLDMYEVMTAPVRVRLDAIASAARLTHGETRDLYLPMVEAELRDLAKALGTSPPKRDALTQTLGAAVDEHHDVLLVARTAEMARMYAAELSRDGALSRVRVTSMGALSEEVPADVAVLTGMSPTWARWVYRAGIAKVVRVLAYAPEGPVESVAKGFNEVDIVRRVIADQTARESWFGRPAAKDLVWSELTGDARLVSDGDDEAPPTSDMTGVTVMVTAPVEVPPGLWDGQGWLAPLEPSGTGTIAGSDGGGVGGATNAVVSAVTVTFEDGRWALMDMAGTVTRFRPGSGRADAAFAVSGLKPGDQVLFFDGDSRKDLLAKVLEVAVEVPALAVAAGWVAHWRRVLVGGYRRFGSYRSFAAALREHGCAVQTQTVRLWVVGVTIGPEDEEDVHRVGLVTEDGALLGGHREVCRAMRSLRGAHSRLGKRLSEVARQVGSAAAAGRLASDEVVDERSGLTAADFQDSLDILTVRRMEPAGDVPYIVVGRLNDTKEEEFNA